MAAAGVAERADLDLREGVSGGWRAGWEAGLVAVGRRETRVGRAGPRGGGTGPPSGGADYPRADLPIASVETACFLQEAAAAKVAAAKRDLTLRRVTRHAELALIREASGRPRHRPRLHEDRQQ